MSSVRPKSGNQKWWQQEIIETVTTTQQNIPEEEKLDLRKSKEFVDTLLRLEGPKVGVKYKIEVTGPLNIKDGTFWACPVSSGFIQDKLEPLSKMLRSSTQADLSFRNVDNFDELVCVQSLENNLWMRGIVIKEIDNQSVKLQLVDVGRIEEHQKNKLCKVSELLASIPYMAFHCTLFEDKVDISFEEKWRFNDLVKKKILNFTCKNIINQGKKKILFGQMETIIDRPVININEEMKCCIVHNHENSPTNAINSKTASGKSGETHNLNKLQISSMEMPVTADKYNAVELNEPSNNIGTISEPGCSKSDELLEALSQIAGPILGNKYKIEVTSPLNADGTFWACPITSGFIRDKLEPMSDLLRSAIQADPGLRTVDNFDGLLCVQSKENRLLMRGIVIKEIDDKSVKIQLIDMGCNEDHLKSKLLKVPASLAAIPYMAFHCTLFEEKVKLSYEERWRFADLCKKKLVEFTCEKFIERDQKKLLIGKIETTVENPVTINVIEEIKRAMESDNF